MDYTNLLLRQKPVAFVGVASIFADAKTLEAYWANSIRGLKRKDLIHLYTK